MTTDPIPKFTGLHPSLGMGEGFWGHSRYPRPWDD